MVALMVNGTSGDVSFDRPYGREAQYSAIVNDPLSIGSGAWLTPIFPADTWMTARGLSTANTGS